jgi:hypothetical protein
VTSLLLVAIHTNQENNRYSNITPKHKNKLRKNILCVATRSQVQEPLNSEFRLQRYDFLKFYVIKQLKLAFYVDFIHSVKNILKNN